MKKNKKLSILLCLVLVFSILLTSVAMAYPSIDHYNAPKLPLSLSGVENARDIGGYETNDGYFIRERRLFRSGNLSAADPSEIEDLEVTKIIDLRTKLEYGRKKDVDVPNATIKYISPLTIPNPLVLESDDWKTLLHAITTGIMEAWDANLYRQYIQDPKAIEATKEFFKEVETNEGNPILWHCTAGKDRTGIMAILLMAALGCDIKDINAEYLVTNYFYEQKARDSYDKAYKLTHIKAIATEFYKYEIVQQNWFDISLEVMRRMTDVYDDDNATLQAYLREVIKLSDDDIEALKEAYLVDKSGAAYQRPTLELDNVA